MASITKKGERKYLIRVSKGTGKGRTFINKIFRGTLADARAEGRRQETLLDSGLRPQSMMTFKEYFAFWILAITPTLAPRTLDGYAGYITRYALGPLGKFKLAEIRNFHIQQIYLSIGKAPGTVRQLHASLNACFSWAIRREYIRQNPCKNLDLPARDQKPIVVLAGDEVTRFVEACKTDPHFLVFEFALETGMRPEEYLALRWADVRDLDVSVEQVVQYNRSGGGYYFKTTKTARSRRRVPISDELRRRLHRHRIEQNVHRLAMKGTWFDHDLVFPNTIGKPYMLQNLTRSYFKTKPKVVRKYPYPNREQPLPTVLGAAGLDKKPGLTLYSLRHTCATLLLLAGVNPKVVADRLGHSSVVITLDTYSHVLPSLQADATELMNKAMRMKAV